MSVAVEGPFVVNRAAEDITALVVRMLDHASLGALSLASSKFTPICQREMFKRAIVKCDSKERVDDLLMCISNKDSNLVIKSLVIHVNGTDLTFADAQKLLTVCSRTILDLEVKSTTTTEETRPYRVISMENLASFKFSYTRASRTVSQFFLEVVGGATYTLETLTFVALSTERLHISLSRHFMSSLTSLTWIGPGTHPWDITILIDRQCLSCIENITLSRIDLGLFTMVGASGICRTKRLCLLDCLPAESHGVEWAFIPMGVMTELEVLQVDLSNGLITFEHLTRWMPRSIRKLILIGQVGQINSIPRLRLQTNFHRTRNLEVIRAHYTDAGFIDPRVLATLEADMRAVCDERKIKFTHFGTWRQSASGRRFSSERDENWYWAGREGLDQIAGPIAAVDQAPQAPVIPEPVAQQESEQTTINNES